MCSNRQKRQIKVTHLNIEQKKNLLKLIRAVICTTGHMLKVQLSLKNDRVCTVASKVPGGQIQIAQGQMKICLRA